jgi:excisionase family DNA binding protein
MQAPCGKLFFSWIRTVKEDGLKTSGKTAFAEVILRQSRHQLDSKKAGSKTSGVTALSEVMRIQEFADRLQISIWTARQWAYQGKIASCKAGKLLLIPVSEVSRLLETNTRPALK